MTHLNLPRAVRGIGSTSSMSMRMSSPRRAFRSRTSCLPWSSVYSAPRDQPDQQPVEIGLHELRGFDAIERLERMREHRRRDQPAIAQAQQVLGLGGHVFHQRQRAAAGAGLRLERACDRWCR